MKPNAQVRTAKEARSWFDENGISIAEWCRKNGVERHTVIDLLHERLKGRRGKAHKAAVALGMKRAPAKVAA
jgi:gp16 family phage-associated protein